MKRRKTLTLLCLIVFASAGITQNTEQNKVEKAFQKGQKTISKIQNIIQIFQPYLVKAQEIYQQGKQLVKDVKSSKMNNVNSTENTNNSSTTNSEYSQPPNTNQSSNNSSNSQQDYNNQNNGGSNENNGTNMNGGSYNQPPQSLPINNPASVNNDGTGNWGNQNNGLYGNCLDVLTGTVMGMGEAEEMPGSIDVVFVVANGAYTLMTPNFARNNGTATYMSNHSTDGIAKWKTVNETEIAETKITIGQFEQIQTNPQISNVVKNAANYTGWLQYPGNKLDGKVFAIKAELDGRTVYGLIAVIKHIGTDGSNGYLKIKIKAMGLDSNGDGKADANMYLRN